MSNPIRIVPELIDPSGHEAIDAAVQALENLRKVTGAFGKQVAGIENFTRQLQALKDVSRELSEQNKTASLFNENGVRIIVQTESAVKNLNRSYQENKQAVEGQRKAVELATNSVEGYEKTLKNLVANYKAVDLSAADAAKQQQQFLTQINLLRGKIDEQTGALKRTNGAMQAATGSYNALVQRNAQLNKELKNLPDAFDKTTGAINRLNPKAVQLGREFADNTTKLKAFDRDLNQHFRNVGNYPTMLQNLGIGFKNLFLGIVGGNIAAQALQKLVSLGPEIIKTTAEFQKYTAVLTNSLGSSVAAAEAMDLIQRIAAKTPFSVASLTGAFVKLVNQGFKPTEEQLINLGDLAASTGKDFDQLAEAVLDAQSGEFERLKEFGIKSKKAGDEVTFTFKGVETTVKNTSSAIQNYLVGLGKVEGVSGSMAAISKTLGGQISNLGDSFDQLFLAIGEGSSGSFAIFLSAVNNLVQGLTELISGEKDAEKQAYASAKANQDQAASAQGLLNRYEELTKDGVRPTKEAKKELDTITLQLRDSLGESVVAIDKETGALVLNKEAVKEAIKQKLLLANQEASTLALRIHAINDEIAVQQNANKTLKSVYETRVAILEQNGLTEKEAKDYAVRAIQGERFASQMEDIIKISKDYLNAQNALQGGLGLVNQKTKERNDLLEKLAELGFKGADVEMLFASAQVRAGGMADDANKKQLGTIELLQKRVKELTEARDKNVNLTEKEAEAYNRQIADLNALIEKYTSFKKEVELAFKAIKMPAIDTSEVDKAWDKTFKKGEKQMQDYHEKYVKNQQEQTRIAREEAEKRLRIQNELRSLMAQVENGFYQVSENLLDRKQGREERALAEQKENELKTLENYYENAFAISSKNEDVQAKLREDYAAAKAKKEEEFRKQEAALKNKQARQDRNLALFEVAIQTGIAIAKAVAESPLTFGLPWSGFAAANGGIQAALIASKPIPQFFRGTTYAPEGLALVDERGPEIIERKGKMYLGADEGPRLTYLERGDKVYTAEQTRNILSEVEANASLESYQAAGRQLQQAERNKSIFEAKKQAEHGRNPVLEDKLDKIIYFLQNRPEFHSNITKDGFEMLKKQAGNTVKYLNRKFPNNG